MRAVWDEVTRAFRLTFVDGLREVRRTGRSHPGWGVDPHLRKGWLWGAPVFILGMIVVFAWLGGAIIHNVFLFYAYGLPVALAANLVWFAVAARSRAKARDHQALP